MKKADPAQPMFKNIFRLKSDLTERTSSIKYKIKNNNNDISMTNR